MKRYIILAGSLIVVGSFMLIQQFYLPSNRRDYEFSSTEFIEPAENFVECYQTADCIKIKGSACHPSVGGKEVCVNKNYFQEYISTIDKLAGSEAEVACPQIYLVTDKTCSCVDSRCEMV